MAQNKVSLGLALWGDNLNTTVLRGFANLGLLARYSSPDILDQIQNPEGTQRPLSTKHSKEALRYAMEARNVDFESDPRAFPEIILNVRDDSVVVLTQLDEEKYTEAVDFIRDDYGTVACRIDIVDGNFRYPAADFAPQISRVDGNHRLSEATRQLEQGVPYSDFPVVPYALYMNLSKDQERKLFADINGEQKKMSRNVNINHLGRNTRDPQNLTPQKKIDWVAFQLTQAGMVFDSMANLGGSMGGYVQTYGGKPKVSVTGIRSAVNSFYQKGRAFESTYRDDPSLQVEVVNSFFLALRTHYSDAWEDGRMRYIVLEAIGLNGFSKFGGALANLLPRSESHNSYEHFSSFLSILRAAGVNGLRREFAGMYGAAGAENVFAKCMQAIYDKTGVDIQEQE